MVQRSGKGASYPPPLFIAELESPPPGSEKYVPLPRTPDGAPVFEVSGESAAPKNPLLSPSSPRTYDPDRPVQANPWPFYLEEAVSQPAKDEAVGEGHVQADPWPYHGGPPQEEEEAPRATVHLRREQKRLEGQGFESGARPAQISTSDGDYGADHVQHNGVLSTPHPRSDLEETSNRLASIPISDPSSPGAADDSSFFAAPLHVPRPRPSPTPSLRSYKPYSPPDTDSGALSPTNTSTPPPLSPHSRPGTTLAYRPYRPPSVHSEHSQSAEGPPYPISDDGHSIDRPSRSATPLKRYDPPSSAPPSASLPPPLDHGMASPPLSPDASSTHRLGFAAEHSRPASTSPSVHSQSHASERLQSPPISPSFPVHPGHSVSSPSQSSNPSTSPPPLNGTPPRQPQPYAYIPSSNAAISDLSSHNSQSPSSGPRSNRPETNESPPIPPRPVQHSSTVPTYAHQIGPQSYVHTPSQPYDAPFRPGSQPPPGQYPPYSPPGYSVHPPPDMGHRRPDDGPAPPLPPRPAAARNGAPPPGFTPGMPNAGTFSPPPRPHYYQPPPQHHPMPSYQKPPPSGRLFGSSSAKRFLDRTNQVLEETLDHFIAAPATYQSAPPASYFRPQQPGASYQGRPPPPGHYPQGGPGPAPGPHSGRGSHPSGRSGHQSGHNGPPSGRGRR